MKTTLFEVKSSADISKLNKEIKNALYRIGCICKLVNGVDYVMTITSGNDGLHMKGSKHYTNDAIDIRSRDMEDHKKLITQMKIQQELGRNFDVVLEPTHIHIEYDKK